MADSDEDYANGGLFDALKALDIHGSNRSGDSGEAEGDSDPELGDDILDVRRRALAAAATRKTATGAEPAAAAAAVAAVQIDLNEESNLADLEDARLLAHREAARKELQEYNRRQEQLPNYNDLRAKSLAGRKTFGALLRTLEEKFMEARCAVEKAHRASADLKQLRRGEAPHGYPGTLDTDPAGALARLQKGVKASAQEYEQTFQYFEALKNSLYDLRRENDALIAGLDVLAALAQQQ